MQPAVRACVPSSKRAETAKGSRHCNITEFFKKWHGERVLHHLQRAKILEQEKKIVTKPLLEAETMLQVGWFSFLHSSGSPWHMSATSLVIWRNPSEFITARKPVRRELPDSTCYLHVSRKQQSRKCGVSPCTQRNGLWHLTNTLSITVHLSQKEVGRKYLPNRVVITFARKSQHHRPHMDLQRARQVTPSFKART